MKRYNLFWILMFMINFLTINGQNVGIGTTNPLKKLDVRGSLLVNDSIFVRDRLLIGISERDGELIVKDSDGDKSVITRYLTKIAEVILGFNESNQGILGTQTNHDLRIRTNGVNRMTIKNSGEVGIGTTTPTAPFHVRKSGEENQRTIIGILEAGTSDRPTLLFSENGNPDINDGMSIEYNGSGSGDDNKMSINKIGGGPAMTIENGGNVGIGTDNPAFPFQVINNQNSSPIRILEAHLNGGVKIGNSPGTPEANGLQVANLGGDGDRTLYVNAQGQIKAEDKFQYYSKATDLINFISNEIAILSLEIKDGVTIEEIQCVVMDNSSEHLNIKLMQGELTGNGYFYTPIASTSTESLNNSDSPFKLTINKQEISSTLIDNSRYTYSLWVTKSSSFASDLNFYAIHIKYSL